MPAANEVSASSLRKISQGGRRRNERKTETVFAKINKECPEKKSGTKIEKPLDLVMRRPLRPPE